MDFLGGKEGMQKGPTMESVVSEDKGGGEVFGEGGGRADGLELHICDGGRCTISIGPGRWIGCPVDQDAFPCLFSPAVDLYKPLPHSPPHIRGIHTGAREMYLIKFSYINIIRY